MVIRRADGRDDVALAATESGVTGVGRGVSSAQQPGKPPAAPPDRLTPEEGNRRLKRQLVCKICHDFLVCISFLPCNHLACCEGCAPNQIACPKCNVKVRGELKVILGVNDREIAQSDLLTY